MLSKLDLKLFSLLNEYIDKDLKMGCFIKEKIGGYSIILKPCKDITFDWIVLQNGNIHYENEKRFDIIGTINIGTILQWLGMVEENSNEDKRVLADIVGDKLHTETVLSRNDDEEGTPKHIEHIEIPLTNPLERTDEKKQDFIDFALVIKNKEDEYRNKRSYKQMGEETRIL